MRSRSEHGEQVSSLPWRVWVQDRAVGEAGGTSALSLFGPSSRNRFGSWGHGGLAAGRMGTTAAVSLPWIRAAAAYSALCSGDPGGTTALQREHCFSGENHLPEKSQGKQGESCCTVHTGTRGECVHRHAHTHSTCTGVCTGRPCCAGVHPWMHALGAKDGAGVMRQEAVPAQVLPHTSVAIRVYKMMVTGNQSAGMPILRPGSRLPVGASRGGSSLPQLMGIIR